MSPINLPWWEWILCAVAAGIVSLFFGVFASKKKKGSAFPAYLAAIFGIASAMFLLLGIIRFVKWAWYG